MISKGEHVVHQIYISHNITQPFSDQMKGNEKAQW